MIDTFKFIKNSIKCELVYEDTLNSKKHISKCEIANMSDDKIEIKLGNSDFDFTKLQNYTKLSIVLYTETGVLLGNTNFLSATDKTCYISFPYNNNICQRREDKRIPMHIDFEIEVTNNEEQTECFILKSKNISGKGIACLTADPLPDFQDAPIIMHFQNCDVQASCRKVYSNSVEFNNNNMFLNGIAFTEIDEDGVNTILKKCMQFQIQSKHNEKLFETL